MRHAIETAPKDGHFVILEDDANAVYDIGRWSPQASDWVGKDDRPIKITPTHWHSVAPNAYLQPDDEGTVVVERAGKRAWPGFIMPVAAVIAAATGLIYYAKQEAAPSPIGDGIVIKSAGQPAEETQPVREQRAAATPVPDARQPVGPKPPEALVQEAAPVRELSEARRTIERLEAQLQAGPAAEQALKQERERAATLAEQAASARRELLANAAEHSRALDEERARSARLVGDLATARREIEAQAAQLRQAIDEVARSKQAEATKTGQLLEQHRQNVASLAEAVAARQELTASTAQHTRALEQERARSTSLENELGTARREIETQAARSSQAKAETERAKQAAIAKVEQSLEQQREAVAAALADAAAARQELKARTAQQDQIIDEERSRSAALARELVAARHEIETQAARSEQASAETVLLKQADTPNTEQLLEEQRQKTAAALADAAAARQELTTNAEQHRQALDEERARNATIAGELATAQQANEKLIVQFRLIGEQTELRRRAYEAELAALQQALKQEREKDTAAAELDAARRAAIARSQPETTASALPFPETTSSVALETQGGAEAARMIARASLLLGHGDIGSARIVLERAAELGSARAAFMLAETYDPGILSVWKTYGTRGDVTRARELYAKAQAGGMREAKERLDTLSQ